MTLPIKIDETLLKKYYYNTKLPLTQIAQLFDCAVCTIYERIKILGLPKRSKRNICIVDGCNEFVLGHGLCNLHYKRMSLYGSYECPTSQRKKLKENGIVVNKCRVKNCNRESKCIHLYSMHYRRLKRHGFVECLLDRQKELFASGFGYCHKCKQEKPLGEFSMCGDRLFGIRWYCKVCDMLHRKQYIKRDKNSKLLKTYGITIQQYEDMCKTQGDRCAICGKTREENGRALAVDHCHTTKIVRGLLCHACNYGLGHFRDNINSLQKASLYLQKYKNIKEEE